MRAEAERLCIPTRTGATGRLPLLVVMATVHPRAYGCDAKAMQDRLIWTWYIHARTGATLDPSVV